MGLIRRCRVSRRPKCGSGGKRRADDDDDSSESSGKRQKRGAEGNGNGSGAAKQRQHRSSPDENHAPADGNRQLAAAKGALLGLVMSFVCMKGASKSLRTPAPHAFI